MKSSWNTKRRCTSL